ncbi:ABC transporter related [Pseudarthrobacter chlorophenolicus A6]|uniref:ABC transporter related n=1 Tax=Pseudarthrobacter chlorophenolicus (strain ATCC 700700 / DSM 12829 / CIP 107037 / JCM 12360 / KCTC 9906 / NCIMB 13794 / A6) TaxID=452863 RepID=B8HGN6_PSECP|nr:ATP-binding cassette domain-containing protein [Pseudarthrobacter chlorophenolicus]ACL41302.1 ABC transporter related [Pseudarthrobacter chlorophenolicus A6]SDQ66623.1 energy-coupling factor transport system ATP-binding protein [Pseudarthrobacter chlorophenolicus]
MTFRPAPLRAAAVLAVVFIAVRVIYRVLFNGAGLGAPLLLDLPPLRLPAPYAHVVLLGPVSAPGVWAAILSALPIAATILAFGLLNAWVDVARGFVHLARRGPLQGIARMLVVAWSALPALADAVTSVRLTFRLRGERFGPRALVPILERTLEHAGRVAAALELRGFGSRGTPVSVDDDGGPLQVRGARFRIGGTQLRVADFAPSPGTVSVLTGPTGSGKSTILRGIAGLLSHVDGGEVAGAVRVGGLDRVSTPPRETARVVGVVLQNPRAAFATTRVRDEIALALDLRGVSAADSKARVQEVADRIGVSALLDRTISTLSAGEATLVAIAAAVVEQPALLLVDEPLADLDTTARARVIAVLHALARDAGVCVIVAEHRAEALVPIADSWWAVRDSALVPGTAPAAAASRPTAGPPSNVPAGSATVLTASNLSVYRDGKPLVRDASLTLHRGEVVALVGPNGAGKSSVLVALALKEAKGGRGKADTGTIGVGAGDGGRVALVPDASDDLFTMDTVAGELRAAERRLARRKNAAPLPVGLAAEHLARLRGNAGMPIGHEHPRDLSAGERRILAIALQTLNRPQVLLIDEPTRGLDPAARSAVAAALRAAVEDGATVLIATHDHAFAHRLGARILPMRDGVAPATEPATQAGSLAAVPATTAQPLTVPRFLDRLPDVPARQKPHRLRMPRPVELAVLAAANLLALGAFCWPLLAAALPSDAAAALPYAALAIAPLAAVAVVVLLDGSVRSAHTVALLGVLAAVGSAVRVASTGVGGVEAVFILLVLAGRAFGARFGLLLGAATIALSSALWGGVGPWTPFQVFACAWVGAGAGLLPKGVRGKAELWMLCGYGIVASYLFGLLTNLWFWPFAVGAGTGISYEPGAPLTTNLSSFLLYSLLTSTAGWDTLRAVTTVVGIIVVGRAILAALRRVKPVSGGILKDRTGEVQSPESSSNGTHHQLTS